MRITHKLLSILLAIVMAASAMCLSVMAESKYNYKKVTLIGDSIATALRMEWRGEGAPPAEIIHMYKYNENTNTWTRTGATHGAWVENSWPARVVRGVGLSENDLFNYGREAFSSIEFRRMLDTSYRPSDEDMAISEGLFAAYGDDLQGRGLDYIQTQLPKDLAASDLVLVGMGSNDLFSYAMVHYGNVTAGLETTTLNKVQLQALEAIEGAVAQLVSEGRFQEAFAKVISTAKTVNALEQTLIVMVKVIMQGIQKFIQNWDVIMDRIHECNPKATVMAVSLFNATEGIYLTDEIKLDLGQIMAPVFDIMNNHMKSYAKKTGYYTYVDCTKTSHPAWPTAMGILQDTSMLMYYMMICTHPNYEGQKYMADQVLAALPQKASGRTVKKNPNDGNWYLYDGDKIDTSYTGIAQNEYGWWRIEKGKVNFDANGVYQNEYGWWYVKDGKVDFDYTGFASNRFGTWRIINGKVAFNENGVTGEQKDWRYVENGKVNTSMNSVCQNRFGWWKVTNGRVDFGYNGWASNQYGNWWISGGRVDYVKTALLRATAR